MDYKAILKERGFSDEEIATLLPRLEPAFTSLTTARQSEIDAIKADLDTKSTKLTEDMAEWASMTAAEKAAAGDLRQAIDEAKAEIFRREQIIVRLAEDAGQDPKKLLGHEPVKEPVKPASTFDPKPLREEFGQSMNYLIQLTTDLPMIVEEYQALTGKRMDTRAFRTELNKRAQKNGNIDPQQIADEMFDLPKLRTEAQTKQRETERLQYIEEGKQIARSEAALPLGQIRTTDHDPGPLMRQAQAHGSVLKRPQPGDRTQRALSIASSGKYTGWNPGDPEPKSKTA